MEFTKEQLIEHINGRKEFADECAADSTLHPERREYYELTAEALRIALASLEAEPVGEFYHEKQGDWYQISEGDKVPDNRRIPLFTTPPAPVVPDEAISLAVDGIMSTYADNQDECRKRIRNHIEDACRAAMLQGADGTLTNEGTIPVTQFKPVADLYGLTSPTGGETSFTFDAVEARDFIDGGWSCQEYVELGRFQEAMLQNGNSPAQSDCCPEQNYIAPAQDGNSPVIPDGWVLVPEEPTHEMLEAGDEQFGTYDVYRRMIAASPQQEVKP
ncbi:hypothetical protein ABF69_0211675 [Enterobacter chengduensis]|uniref:hypothetical protein n=1 Tax=Enterobacter chengduensis TaxID=2494701 RepID=UPI00064B2D4B|nr:hypothetical protein [Enterobacter chengduensis]KVK38732.1 hypothetical protein ABF69_0211675 [Enterobacter chengduensis]